MNKQHKTRFINLVTSSVTPQEKTRITFSDLRGRGQKVIAGFFLGKRYPQINPPQKNNAKVTGL